MKGGFIKTTSATGRRAVSESPNSICSSQPPAGHQSAIAFSRTNVAIEIAAREVSLPTRLTWPLNVSLCKARSASWRNTPDPQAGSRIRSVLRCRRCDTCARVCSTMVRASAGGVKCAPPRAVGLSSEGPTRPNRSGAGARNSSKCASWNISLPACRMARLGTRFKTDQTSFYRRSHQTVPLVRSAGVNGEAPHFHPWSVRSVFLAPRCSVRLFFV